MISSITSYSLSLSIEVTGTDGICNGAVGEDRGTVRVVVVAGQEGKRGD